jgi:hypothetical protein
VEALMSRTHILALCVPLVLASACREEDLAPTAIIEGPTEAMVGEWVQLEGTSSSDPEGRSVLFAWSFQQLPEGSQATFNEPHAANPSFLADVPGDFVVQLEVDDGLIFSDPATHTVTATQGNRVPIADAGPDRAVGLDLPVQLDGTVSSDPDGDALTYDWSLVAQPDGADAALDDATSSTPTFTPVIEGLYTWSLVVSDGEAESAEDTVTLQATRDNLPPVANAGVDVLVDVGDVVALDGSGSSDPNGDALTYAWTMATRPLGSTAALDDATVVAPTFTADAIGAYRIQLVVSDGEFFSESDEVIVNAGATNGPPVADAGEDQAVDTGETVQLDGSADDPEGDPVTWRWQLVELPAGSQAALNDPGVANPSFVADLEGTYVAHLWVADEFSTSPPDEVVVTASGVNQPPEAVAGASSTSVLVGDAVLLDSTGSNDPDPGDLITYEWWFEALPPGSRAFLNIPTLARPSFVADVEGDYVVALRVFDGALYSVVETVSIHADPSNAAPEAAISGPASVARGALVELQDASTDDDDDPPFPLHDWWFQSVPPGSTATLNDPTIENPTFTADLVGDYVVHMRVFDGEAWSANIATLTVPAVETNANQPPDANAGTDITGATTGTLVTLDGSGTTDDDDPLALSYLWSFVSIPQGATATLNAVTAISPTFVPDQDGTWVLRLDVDDGEFADADFVTVTTIGKNRAPTACAFDNDPNSVGCQPGTPPQITTREGRYVQLDGSASSDPDNDDLSFHWWFKELPEGFFADFNYDDVVNPSFLADAPGTAVVRLQVNDGTDVSNIDEVEILILEAFKIIDFFPEENQTGLSLQTEVTITFNEDADVLTVVDSNFFLNPGSTSDFAARVPSVISYDPGTYTATLTPFCTAADVAAGRCTVVGPIVLDPLEVYTVTVTQNVTNTIGDGLDREYVWQFETRAGEILLYVEPDEDETDVSVAAKICGIFTEEVDPTTVDENSFFVTFEDRWGRTEHITGSYTFDSLPAGRGKVCLVPEPDEYDCLWDRALLYDTLYTATITTDVELDNDASPPDTLTTDFTWSFETTSEPEILAFVPVDGAEDVPIVIAPLTAEFDRAVDETTLDSDPLNLVPDTVLLETIGGVPVPGTVDLADDGVTVEFWPTSYLDFLDDVEGYVFTVVSGVDGVLDVEGNYLLEDHSVTFHTSPKNAFTMVPNTASGNTAEESDLIELLFERPLDVTTVVAANIELVLDTTVLNANYAYDPDTRTVSITPTPEIAGDPDPYTVTVFPGLLDHLGNPYPDFESVSFQVTGNSNTGPSIDLGPTTSTIQGHDLLWLEAKDNLMVTSVTDDTVILIEVATGNQIPLVVDSYLVSEDRIYLRPSVYLRSGNGAADDYTLEVTSGVTDLSRNAGSGEDTAYVVEIDPPEVSSGSEFPADAATQVPGNTTVSLDFDERMDEATIDLTTVRLLDGSAVVVPGAFELDDTGTLWTFEPADYLNTGITYTIEVTDGATDTAGNPAVPFTSTFTVDDTGPGAPTVVPDDGATGVSVGVSVELTFGEDMHPDTFSESTVGIPGNVRLLDPSDNDVYLCIDVDGSVVTLDPVDVDPETDLPLGYSIVYDVYVAGVTDVADNPLDPSPFESSFTTEGP